MKITVWNERENSTHTVLFSGKTIRDLLQKLKLNSEVFIMVRNKEVVTADEELQDRDKIELLSVISGG